MCIRDSDYALNDDVLHLAMIDAMGHGLSAAVMATLAMGAYRHARRLDVGLDQLYAAMDEAIAGQFGADRFVTAQMGRLDVRSGLLLSLIHISEPTRLGMISYAVF